MKTTLLKFALLTFFLTSGGLWAQQGIGTNSPSPNAALDVVSIDKGVLIPRLSLTASNTFFTGATALATDVGLLVYNTNATPASLDQGFYYWNGTYWIALASSLNDKDEQQLSEIWHPASEEYELQLTDSTSATLDFSAFEEVKTGTSTAGITPTAEDGDLFWDTDDDKLYAYDGTTWNLLHTDVPSLSFGPVASATNTQTTLTLQGSSDSLSLQASGTLTFSQTGTNTLLFEVPETAAQNLAFANVSTSAASLTISGGGTPVSLQATGSISFSDNGDTLVLTGNQNALQDADGDTRIQVEETNDEDIIRFDTAGSERFQISATGEMLFANPGSYGGGSPPNVNSAVLGIEGTTHGRLRLTAGSQDSRDPSQGASIDLHGINANVKAGDLDLVAGSSTLNQGGAIRFFAGSVERGTWSATGSLTLNSNATLIYNQVEGSNTHAAGNVLTSDASGAARWSTPRTNVAPFTTLTANTTLVATTHHTVLVQPNNGATDIIITLPTAATAGTGSYFIIKMLRNGGTGNVVINTPGTENIDGASNRTLYNNYQKVTLQTDGSDWFIISE